MLDQFLWGHSSRDCYISCCFAYLGFQLHFYAQQNDFNWVLRNIIYVFTRIRTLSKALLIWLVKLQSSLEQLFFHILLSSEIRQTIPLYHF